MKRSDVYELIDCERTYQDGFGHPDNQWSVAHWLIFMQSYLNKSMNDLQYIDDVAALNHVRKIAALAVACMENNETNPRQ